MDLSPVDNDILDEFNARLLPLHDQLENPPAVPDLERAAALLRKQKRSVKRITRSLDKLQELICNSSRALHRGDTSTFLADPHDGHDTDSVALEGATPAIRRVANGRSDHEKFGYLKIDAIRDADIGDTINLGPNYDHRPTILRNQPTHESSFRDRSCSVLLDSSAGPYDSFPTPYLRSMSHQAADAERRQLFRSTNHKADPKHCDSHPLWASLVDSSDLMPSSGYRNEPHTITSVPLIKAPGAGRSINGHDSDLDTSPGTDDIAPIEIGSDISPGSFSRLTTAYPESLPSVPDSPESIDSRIRAANSAHRLPDGTIERFLPRKWLSDLNITESLRLLLPLNAEPLIASQAIENFPESGLARKWRPTDAPVPILRHSQHCTHLFIAYNVVYGTLDDMGRDRNNHWVLVAVDITRAQIHVFGADSQLLRPGILLASNIGAFINNCRSKRSIHPINWSDPQLQPLYGHSLPPDGFNCGITVISRAISFLYPSWALDASTFTAPSEASSPLNEWRSLCLWLFLDRYRVIHTTNNLVVDELSSTNLPKKRPAIPTLHESPEARILRTSTDSPIERPIRLSLREIQDWKTCVRACAIERGFDEHRVLEAFEYAPDQPIEDVLRILQCMCEVASPNILIQLKSALLYQRTCRNLHSSALISTDVGELSRLHIFINDSYTGIPYLSRFEALRSWISYSKCFDAAVAARAQKMKSEKSIRRRHTRLTTTQRRIPYLEPKAATDNAVPKHTAEHLVRRSLEESLVQQGINIKDAQSQIKKYRKYSKNLQIVLGNSDTCSLIILPLQAAQNDCFSDTEKPILDLMSFQKPGSKPMRRLEQPISINDLLGGNRELANYFGKHLFTARPELEKLSAQITSIFSPAEGVHPLCARTDASISATKPKDVAELFETSGS